MQTAPLTPLETRLLAKLKALVGKTDELIEHLQATGRLQPCFNLPALTEARDLIAECEPEPIPVGEAVDSDFGAFGAAL